MSDIDRVVNFFFEVGILQHVRRSGNVFLGSGEQTVASHIFRTVLIGYTMAKMASADPLKVILMTLFHDVEETRTGDLNYLQQMYVKSDDERALKDLLDGLPMSDEVYSIIKEYSAAETLEAKLAKDADTLELILFLKEQMDKGNKQAENWISAAKKRLITTLAKELAISIEKTNYYDWWYGIRNDWENGTKKW
ncbi:MAG: HD domain-containing protein [Calditerrivibrio sp.]|nr:HD domain-containing protein [Calditerrivibrio sp.]